MSAISPKKLTSEQVKEYYRDVHKGYLSSEPSDETAPVITPDGCRLLNDFTDFAHRLGMRRGFQYLKRHYGSLNGRDVLDLGCGRGRWCKEYDSRGAKVTGVDISSDAVEWLSERFPQHRFICADVAGLPFAEASFDVINSVTVIQHMPEEQQRAVFSSSYRFLRKGGHMLILENIADFGYPHVHAHRKEEWVRMAQGAGLRPCREWGSNFEVLVRAAVRVRGKDIPTAPELHATAPRTDPAHRRAFESIAKNAIALLSFPCEWLCHFVPVAKPSHALMIFQKTE